MEKRFHLKVKENNIIVCVWGGGGFESQVAVKSCCLFDCGCKEESFVNPTEEEIKAVVVCCVLACLRDAALLPLERGGGAINLLYDEKLQLGRFLL